ncbi:unnamed protein product [Symbiodinium pilosum]|uniref:Uncharacterized protein n=1 Tax=Symbiodinium pilosum TaxID=2952 RepID=A0A812XFE0_SYMPI|nr:unnamed protein product [Symbiodinium pilosum]
MLLYRMRRWPLSYSANGRRPDVASASPFWEPADRRMRMFSLPGHWHLTATVLWLDKDSRLV